jgi:amino-acid N-acetyltransferase
MLRAGVLRGRVVSISQVGADELSEVRALLEANGLPTSELSTGITLLATRDLSGLEGIVGLEVNGRFGLLRSLAVRSDRRGGGLGSALVAEVEGLAATRGIASLYLLTTTAEPFFGRRGYRAVPRESAPAEIRATSEFATVCPASAAFMTKSLTAPAS